MDYGVKPNQKTKYESESGTTEVPRSTAAKELPRNDGDEGWSLAFIILSHKSLFTAFGDMVNCGGHTARTCDQCPYDDDIYRGYVNLKIGQHQYFGYLSMRVIRK